MNNCSRFVIAGVASGVGKTSISLGLAAALLRRNLKVQTFKVGPDFLDPTYLTMASDRTCYNLDSWMMDRNYVQKLFIRNTINVDIAVIEGVMGMFDGVSPASLEASTAEIADLVSAPVILVVDTHGLAGSFAAIVKGFAEFRKNINIAGVIANNCGSENHKKLLNESLISAGLPPLIGAIRKETLPSLPGRHLGLVTADKETLSEDIITQLARRCEQDINIDALLNIAQSASAMPANEEEKYNSPKKIRIGIAKDQAFHFYYPDNLEALQQHGFELIPFSPINNKALPKGLQALYIGGGYPEEYAEALSKNDDMLNAIRDFSESGKCIYAECGGLMYLGRELETKSDQKYRMTDVIPIVTRMLNRLKSLGYVEATLTEDSIWGPKGSKLRGHEFHYSEITNVLSEDSGWKTAYRLTRTHDNAEKTTGFQKGNILASYIHVHFASQPEPIKHFLTRCKDRL